MYSYRCFTINPTFDGIVRCLTYAPRSDCVHAWWYANIKLSGKLCTVQRFTSCSSTRSGTGAHRRSVLHEILVSILRYYVWSASIVARERNHFLDGRATTFGRIHAGILVEFRHKATTHVRGFANLSKKGSSFARERFFVLAAGESPIESRFSMQFGTRFDLRSSNGTNRNLPTWFRKFLDDSNVYGRARKNSRHFKWVFWLALEFFRCSFFFRFFLRWVCLNL